MFTIKKFHGGEEYETEDGKKWVHTQGKMWAVVNEMGQVLLAGKHCIHMYRLKYIAQYEADKQNEESNG